LKTARERSAGGTGFRLRLFERSLLQFFRQPRQFLDRKFSQFRRGRFWPIE
jgi:hypothetical protein